MIHVFKNLFHDKRYRIKTKSLFTALTMQETNDTSGFTKGNIPKETIRMNIYTIFINNHLISSKVCFLNYYL